MPYKHKTNYTDNEKKIFSVNDEFCQGKYLVSGEYHNYIIYN